MTTPSQSFKMAFLRTMEQTTRLLSKLELFRMAQGLEHPAIDRELANKMLELEAVVDEAWNQWVDLREKLIERGIK